MEDVTTSTDRAIMGASGLERESDNVNFSGPPLSPDDLPMIVWLRGDEAYLDDFCLDAEAAMKALGIKRSRLTQISGRELRVGRLRVDRYTRPVYRIEDIEAYKSWTRATASHLRASTVIQEAASKLEEQSKDLSDQLRHMFLGQLERLEQEVVELKTSILEQRQVFAQEAQNAINTSQSSFLTHITQNYEDIRLLFASLQSAVAQTHSQQQSVLDRLSQQETLKGDIAALAQRLAELAIVMQGTKTAQDEATESQAQFNRDLGKALSIVLQFQRESIKKNEEAIAASKDLAADIRAQAKEAESVAEADKPKRRMPYALRRRVARRMV